MSAAQRETEAQMSMFANAPPTRMFLYPHGFMYSERYEVRVVVDDVLRLVPSPDNSSVALSGETEVEGACLPI